MASSVEMKKQHHAVAIPLCAQGHLNPLVRFCEKLASHGFTITLVYIDPIHDRLAELNPPHEEEPADHESNHANSSSAAQPHDRLDIRRAHIPIDGLDLGKDFRVSLEHFLEAQNRLASPLEELLRKLNRDGPPVTCLISDIGLTGGTQKVADMFNIPRIVLYTCSASVLLLSNYVLQGGRVSKKQVFDALMRREQQGEIFYEGLPGLPTILNKDLPYFKHVVDDNAYMWELLLQTLEESNRQAHAMVVNSFQDLEAPTFKALSNLVSLPTYGVGPLVDPLHQECTTSLWKEDETCILWLDKQPPLSVLYICFGSFTLLSQSQLEEIIEGLLSSQQRFLWVFRPDLVENSLDTTFSLDLLSKSHDKGYVVDWAPQLRVLSHPSVGGFLTHCGWNSILEAISRGVPMLCWPYFADQFIDAKYVVEEWKIGLRFTSNKEDGCFVERGEIERAIHALMQDEYGDTLRKNVLRLKEASHQSQLEGGTSYKDIKALIESLE
eukprot:c24073_g2_i1 orf=182-1669(-)